MKVPPTGRINLQKEAACEKVFGIVLVVVCLLTLCGCANRRFDVLVSWAGSSKPIGELNSDKIGKGEVRHLPIWRIDTLEELEQFKQTNQKIPFHHGRDDILSFDDNTAKYDEEFFAKNSLILVYVLSASSSWRYYVKSIYHDKTSFCVHVVRNPRVQGDDMDMAGWLFSITVPDKMIANCIDFDADLDADLKK